MIWMLLSILGGSFAGLVTRAVLKAPEETTAPAVPSAEAEESDTDHSMQMEDTPQTGVAQTDDQPHQHDHTDPGSQMADDHQANAPADSAGDLPSPSPAADDHFSHMDASDTPPNHSGHMDMDDDTTPNHSGHMDMDDDAHDMHDHHDHGAHANADSPQTPEEIAAFVAQVIAAPDVHVHGSDSPLMGEHLAMLDLVDKAEATHIAIGSGSWFDPSNWHNGEVPGDDAKVLVSNGITLEYDAQSDARLFTVRVDGELNFATDQDSKMVVDTFVVAPNGTLTIGTADNPVEDDVTAEIVIANNGAIDVDWDPSLLSRGLISHGEVSIHGQIKDSHEKVIEDPMAGDTSITFDELPVGWEVGDKIVIAGTDYEGHKWDESIQSMRFYESEDEVRIITDIIDGEVFFDAPLEFDHATPRDDLFTSVANYSRNVKISTEDPDTAEVYERGHVMFMHSDNVDVRYAEFYELGRTDKSEEAFDAGEVTNIAFDTNVKGRYGLHLHRLGTENQDDPALVVGNAVYGSPGWGFAHHDSNAVLDNNASFDTFGAGFVAESGNETGVWSDNIAILAEGNNIGDPKLQADATTFDTARSGDGFWLQSRLIDVSDNVAASVNHGFVYYHRGEAADDAQLYFDSETFAFSEALLFSDAEFPDKAPILTFEDNEAFAAKQGLHVVKHSPIQNHDVHSELSGFTAWNVLSGAYLEYTAHYLLTDFDLVGADREPGQAAFDGIQFGNNVSDITISNSQISNFENGIDLYKFLTISNASADQHQYNVIDTEITDFKTQFSNYDADLDTITTSDNLSGGTPELTLDGPFTFSNMAGILNISGTKTDSLGEIDFPSGTDRFQLYREDVVNILEEKGYYTTPDGQHSFVLEVFFTDRLTGDIYKQPTLIHLHEDLDLGGPAGWQYTGAIDNGSITQAELDAMVAGGPTKVEFTSQHDTIEVNNLFNLDVHDNWDAYNTLTEGQEVLSEDATPPAESHDENLDLLDI